MINRIPDSLPLPKRKQPPPKPGSQALSELAQQQITYRLRQVETYVQAHPVTGIGAAFCIGILLGWIIKRR